MANKTYTKEEAELLINKYITIKSYMKNVLNSIESARSDFNSGGCIISDDLEDDVVVSNSNKFASKQFVYSIQKMKSILDLIDKIINNIKCNIKEEEEK